MPYIENSDYPDLPLTVQKGMAEPIVNSFNFIPIGTMMNVIFEVLVAGSNVDEIPDRKRQIDHAAEYRTGKDETHLDGRTVECQTEKSSIKIRMDSLDRISTNGTTQKILIYIFINANKQAFHNGKLTREFVRFPLQDLVDLGIYSSRSAARKGFYRAVETLMGMTVTGYIQYGTSKKEICTLTGLFRKIYIEDNMCVVQLESDINWDAFIMGYTILPDYYFRLSKRASELLFYIFYIARQRLEDIEKKGYFTINLRAIQERLFLPDKAITGTDNPKRTISDEIKKALKDIEENHRRDYRDHPKDFQLILRYNDNKPIHAPENLNSGYLQVFLSGEFAKPFIEMNRKKAKKIEAKKNKSKKTT